MIDVNLCWSCGDIINENIVEQNENTNEPIIQNDDTANGDLSKFDNDSPDNKNIAGIYFAYWVY